MWIVSRSRANKSFISVSCTIRLRAVKFTSSLPATLVRGEFVSQRTTHWSERDIENNSSVLCNSSSNRGKREAVTRMSNYRAWETRLTSLQTIDARTNAISSEILNSEGAESGNNRYKKGWSAIYFSKAFSFECHRIWKFLSSGFIRSGTFTLHCFWTTKASKFELALMKVVIVLKHCRMAAKNVPSLTPLFTARESVCICTASGLKNLSWYQHRGIHLINYLKYPRRWERRSPTYNSTQ